MIVEYRFVLLYDRRSPLGNEYPADGGCVVLIRACTEGQTNGQTWFLYDHIPAKGGKMPQKCSIFSRYGNLNHFLAREC